MSNAMTHPLKTYSTLLLLAACLWAGQAAWGQGNGTQAPSPPLPGQPPSTNQPSPAKPATNGWGLSINKFLSDDEMDMLFDYLRDAFIATVRNDPEEASMPPELAFKLAILRQRLIREGDAAVQQLMQALQKEVDRALLEYQLKQPPQPPQPPVQEGPGRS
jgi:hypothetical protein